MKRFWTALGLSALAMLAGLSIWNPRLIAQANERIFGSETSAGGGNAIALTATSQGYLNVLCSGCAAADGITGTLTAGRLPYASGAQTLVDSANLRWDGTLYAGSGTPGALYDGSAQVKILTSINHAADNGSALMVNNGITQTGNTPDAQIFGGQMGATVEGNFSTGRVVGAYIPAYFKGVNVGDFIEGALIEADYYGGSGGSTPRLTGVTANIYVGAGYTVDDAEVLRAVLQDGAEGTLTNLTGLLVGDMTDGVNNWAIKTGAGLVSFGDNLQLATGKGFRPDTTTAHTALFQAYDNDTGPGYVTFGTLLNGNAPSLTFAPPAGGGTMNFQGLYKSNDGTAGLTQTCAAAVVALTIKNGLITSVTCP